MLLAVAAIGCGSDQADTESLVPSTLAVSVSSLSPVATTTVSGSTGISVDTPTRPYTVTAGDTLYGIAGRHCSTVDELILLNGWADGSSHPIFPDDTMLVPSASCQDSKPSDSATITTTTEPAGGIVDPGPYNWTLWGDPADFGAIYATPQCTELQDARAQLTSESLSLVEDPVPGDRFLAAVAALPDQPTPSTQAAIEATVAIYTEYAPVWTRVQREAMEGLNPADNPVWRAAIDVFNAGEAQRTAMWDYVDEQCPAVGNSEDALGGNG